ncbi:MAG: DNA-binding protein [Clostridia bacterium]
MNNRLTVTKLFDRYGELLTERQRAQLTKYVLLDCSFSEIAELEGVSKQAVFDSVRRAENRLLEFERILRCVARETALIDIAKKIASIADSYDDLRLNELSNDILSIMEDDYGV